MKIQSKLPATGTSIFATMSALAVEHGAVNLGQGFPDFPMSEELIQLVNESMIKGFNQYAPMPGWPPLLKAIANKVEYLYNVGIDPSTEITITPGGTYAIYSALTTILRPGDEVIIFEPAYDSYKPGIEINGAKAVAIELQSPYYTIDWKQVEEKINERTRAIIINSPSNPTGTILSRDDLKSLEAIISRKDIFIISDEVYEHLIFDDLKHESILKYPELFKRSFVCFSFGKVYHCTGWKLGYCVAPAVLSAEFRKVHQFNCFSCHMPSQAALAEFLDKRESYISLGEFYQQKRDLFINLMKATKFELLPCKGSYFICARYNRLSNEGDMAMAIRLTKEAGVVTIPVSAFYGSGKDEHVLRFCFAKKEETLKSAVEKLARIN